MGAGLCWTLYGCGERNFAADGEKPFPLQEIAVDTSRESDILSGGAQGEFQSGGLAGGTLPEKEESAADIPGSAQPTASPAAWDIHDRGLEEIKDYLAQYPDTLQELSEAECYVVLHGKEYSGREYLDSFMGNVQTEAPDELVIVQFTVEGDPILIYLNYDVENVYCVEDASRDAWVGNGEKYFEKEYDSVWLGGEADTEGNFYISLYAGQDQDMIVEMFTAETEDPLMCGLPPVESSGMDQSMQKQPGVETKSNTP